MNVLEDLSLVVNRYKVDNPFQDVSLILQDPSPSSIPPDPPLPDPSAVLMNGDSSDHCELSSNTLLNYIRQILMDEDVEVQGGIGQEPSALQEAEKSFYEILGKKYPPLPDHHSLYRADNLESAGDDTGDTVDGGYDHYWTSHNGSNNNGATDSNWVSKHSECSHQNELVPPIFALSINHSTQLSDSPGSSAVEVAEGCKETLVENHGAAEIFGDSGMWQLRKEVEEDGKFLPNCYLSFNVQMKGFSQDSKQETKEFLPSGNFSICSRSDLLSQKSKPGAQLFPNGKLVVGPESPGSGRLSRELKEVTEFRSNGNMLGKLEISALPSTLLGEENKLISFGNVVPDLESKDLLHNLNLGVQKSNVKVERKGERGLPIMKPAEANGRTSLRGHKNSHEECSELEAGRNTKHFAIGSPTESVRSEMFDQLLLYYEGKSYESVTQLREAMQNFNAKNAKTPKGSNGTKSRGKRQGRREIVDLRSLLSSCAQVVSTDDHRSANELLKQIHRHSSPYGDGMQRLAHYFAESLEARLAGTGGQIYSALNTKRTSTSSVLKAHHLFAAACPFRRLSHYFSNQTILNVAENATRLHIVDFGILYGFQWPSFIQRLSARPDGPPQLRITLIDFPQPGFKPTERIEEAGRRLSEYARMFNVPFQYKAITSKWENIDIDDLDLDEDEVLVVNCLYRLRHLPDETVVVDCPRDIVLNNIRKMNPKVFIVGIINGSYSAPFFMTRFREVLFYFSALFDMLEATTPRDHPERILIEREICGQEMLNVVACEGSERIERPETYKQWHVRHRRAGFVPLPLNQEMIKRTRERLMSVYHKDFMVDEDSHWLLQGWKGRILQALSTWAPNYDH